MLEIEKIREILKFLENKHNTKFQLKLIEEKQVDPNEIKEETDLYDYKFCYSSVHNTNNLICLNYHKKNY